MQSHVYLLIIAHTIVHVVVCVRARESNAFWFGDETR